MSIVDYPAPVMEAKGEPAAGIPDTGRPLHRLAKVRQVQGITRRTVARRLNIDINDVKLQEDESSDLPLSTLYEWQEVLDVPISELLVEDNDPLSTPVMRRAQLVRLMKTATAILQRSAQPGIRRMAQVLVDQLVEVMPELANVSPWHVVGKRRTQDELGQAAQRGLWSSFVQEFPD